MPPTTSIDAHVRLDTHPTHPSAVTAVLTGSQAHVPHVGLEAADWTVVAKNVLVLVRIDHEEPYWAEKAAQHLAADGITVEITPRLREAMDEEWTWASYPMPWCTRTEIREVSNEAQKAAPRGQAKAGRIAKYGAMRFEEFAAQGRPGSGIWGRPRWCTWSRCRPSACCRCWAAGRRVPSTVRSSKPSSRA